MKALIFALAGSASAVVTNCAIPAPYVVNSGTTCTGPAVGYRVFGFCSTGLTTPPYTITGLPSAAELTTATSTSFTSATVGAAPGCSIPGVQTAWTVAAGFGAPLSAVPCPAITALGELSVADAGYKGIYIGCDRTNGYFPVQGTEGSAICAPGDVAGAGIFPAPAAAVSDYFYFPDQAFTPYALIQAADPTIPNTNLQFTTGFNLICARSCTLPTFLCNTASGVQTQFIGMGPGFTESSCSLFPQQITTVAGIQQPVFNFFCRQFDSPAFTVTCNAAGTAIVSSAYTGQCGVGYGALLTPLWNYKGHLNGFGSLSQTAGQIYSYPAVTSVMTTAYTTTNAFASIFRAGWLDHAAVALQSGAVYRIDVSGCESLTGAALTACVQNTLNWWRCIHDVDFQGATCVAGGVLIACPNRELGFICKNGSKKGLLGLLGLLGIIPLALLLCCLLWLCCIRRRKTEGDVHFATFDPHAAPVVGAQPCTTATAVPTAFNACAAPYTSAAPCF